MGGRLAGKVAIVTGAASGFGAATARRYAAEGAAVVCADRAAEGVEEVVEAIRAAGGDAAPAVVDVTDRAATEGLAATARERFGPADVMFANAGIAGVGTAMDCEPDVWDRVIAVNLTGVWLSMRAVLPDMVARGSGSIIATASVGGLVGVKGIAPYAAAKAGVIGLVRQAAVDFGAAGVRVNAIAPGTAPTPLVTETYAAREGGAAGDVVAERLEQATSKYPLGRLGTVEEIANLALFLASDEASWITGAVHVIDGGMTAA